MTDPEAHPDASRSLRPPHEHPNRPRLAIGAPQFGEELIRQCAPAAGADLSTRDRDMYARMARAIRLIKEQPFARQTVARLASAAGMSRSSFAQTFSKQYGQTPIAFVKRERLRHAAHLLSTTSMAVKLAAGQAGYSSRSSFCRAFQREFGESPSGVRGLGVSQSNLSPDRNDSGSSHRPRPLNPWLGAGSPTLADGSAAETILRAAYERLHTICSVTLDVMWDIDLATGRIWWSEGMLHVFGYGPGQVGTDAAWHHAHIHPEDRRRVIDGLDAARASDAVLWRDEFRYRKADGAYVRVDDRGAIVRDATGKAIRFLGAMRRIA